MTGDNKPTERTAKPGSLLSQWWTIGAIMRDKRTSGRHMKVAWVIIDRYMQARGNGRASLRYIERATGLTRRAVVRACRELVDWNYASRRVGSGTRPSEFSPNWVTGAQSATSKHDNPSGVQTDTTRGVQTHTTNPPSGVQTDTESYLPEPADKPASRVSSNGSDGAATPPHAAGLAPASGETPPGGFEGFWNSYSHKQRRAKAKAAWAKLDPAPDLVATIITEAGRWAEHYASNSIEPRWRVLPHNWLAGENWLQDLPIIHTDPKSAAISKTRGSAKPAATATKGKPGKSSGRTTARITSADVVTTGSITELRVETTDSDGAVLDYIMSLEHDDYKKQEEGQRQLRRLVSAAGLAEIEDSAELLGRTIILTGDEDEFSAPTTRPEDEPPLPEKREPVRYARPPANDNTPPRQPTEWEQRKAAQWRRESGRREWDAAHPEMFVDTPSGPEMKWAAAIKATGHDDDLPPPPDDWPEWLDAEQDDAA